MQRYYLEKFAKESNYIPYGAPVAPVATKETLQRFQLEERKYILYVSRMEPENNAHRVVEAFERTKTDKKLVMVGDAPYSSDYIAKLRSTRDPRIIFTGYVFGQGYRELQSHAYFYVQATEVGGTHPALLEGMGYGNCVLANDVPEHREVLGEAGIYFNTHGSQLLGEKMQHLLNNPGIVQAYRCAVVERVRQKYSWEKVTDDYERLFRQVARKR